ncbi:MAG: acyl--CoA ligase [Deltaproteobacteria bacterium]|nr:acyl--CoA ligase [Deltaproteobacteria bacterium]
MYEQLREVWQELTAPGALFEVHQVVTHGVPVRAYASAPSSLREVWLGSAGHDDKEYLVYQDERWTFSKAHRDVTSIASWLVERGIGPGDRVAIAMRNYPEWMLAYWATISIGATCVGMNAWWTGPELAYGLTDADPKVLICDGERLERILPHAAELGSRELIAVRAAEPLPDRAIAWSELLGHDASLPDLTIDPDSDACIFYTSGTTGRPKGAQLTHRGCVNNLYSLMFWNMAAAAASAHAKGPSSSSDDPTPLKIVSLVCTPLFHVTANNCVAHSATLAGGKLIFMYKWNAGHALELIERERVTHLSGVPTMSRELLAHSDFEKTDTSSLKSLGGGGAQIQPDLVDKIDRFVATARPTTGYGMTETCGIITANSADYFVDKPASAGPAMPVFETKCVDQDGKDVGQGEIGELCVRGAQVIRGYLNRPEATAEAIQDGWLRTGDVARIDEDGFIFIVDRAKDMVLRGGENVYCADVEATIASHVAVLECAVFGVEDERLGEEVAAAVHADPKSGLNAEALRAFCAENLANYKIPRYLWLLDEPLPRNASGKFLKKQLRADLDPADAQ